MFISRFLPLVGVLMFGLATLPCAVAQDAPATDDHSAAGTTAATDLFPAGGAQPSTGTNDNAPTGAHHNGGGGHQRNGRHHDLLVSQADTDPLMVRVAYRRAKTTALAREPDLAILLHEAAAAGTDVEKRVYLKQYYTRLFATVCKVDTSPEMKAHVDLLMQVAEQRYDPKRREVGGDEDLVNGAGRGRRGRVQ